MLCKIRLPLVCPDNWQKQFGPSHFYRLQRSWGKVMFLQASVILLTGGRGYLTPPSGSRHLPGSRHPLWSRHPRSRHPPEQTPPKQTPPGADSPPPRADTPQSRHPPQACCEIWSMRRWYASYWNAILFYWKSTMPSSLLTVILCKAESHTWYRSGMVNSNTVNSKFHLIRSFCEIFARFLSFHV